MVKSFEDPRSGYWHSYSHFQQVKHRLIEEYLKGWFPKLGFWAGRVVYMDTHAGRGSHVSGDYGSPLVALQTFLDHKARDVLLTHSEFRFVFLERDVKNVEKLRLELENLGELPRRVVVETECCEAFKVLRREVATLSSAGQQMAPAFLFVDPYGFNLPGDLLARIMKFDRVELFLNVMWRELDMAIQQSPGPSHGLGQRLNGIFGDDAWKAVEGATMVQRADKAAEILAKRVGAKWWTHIRMVTGGSAVRYFLLHLTNHDAGRDLMKECVWKLRPDGNLNVRRSENPDQFFLVEPKPDLSPLAVWLRNRITGGPVSRDSLEEELRSTIWLPKHFREVEKQMRKQGRIRERNGVLSLSDQAQLFE